MMGRVRIPALLSLSAMVDDRRHAVPTCPGRTSPWTTCSLRSSSKKSKMSSRLSGSIVCMLYSVQRSGCKPYPHSGCECLHLNSLSLIKDISRLLDILWRTVGDALSSSSSSSSRPSSVSFTLNLDFLNFFLVIETGGFSEKCRRSLISVWQVSHPESSVSTPLWIPNCPSSIMISFSRIQGK